MIITELESLQKLYRFTLSKALARRNEVISLLLYLNSPNVSSIEVTSLFSYSLHPSVMPLQPPYSDCMYYYLWAMLASPMP